MRKKKTHVLQTGQSLQTETELTALFLDEIKGGTVLHQQGNPSGAAARWCTSNSGWRYVEAPKMVGSEDQQVVLMDVGLAPEYLSRGRNLLVIVTTRGKER